MFDWKFFLKKNWLLLNEENLQEWALFEGELSFLYHKSTQEM